MTASISALASARIVGSIARTRLMFIDLFAMAFCRVWVGGSQENSAFFSLGIVAQNSWTSVDQGSGLTPASCGPSGP